MIAGGDRSGKTGGMPSGSRPSPAVNQVLRLAAAAALLAVLPLLAGCDALAKAGAGAQHPPSSSFTVSARVTAVVIHGGSGAVGVTGSARSTVSVSQQAAYSATPPKATHVLRGTTLTLSYTCPAELVCAMSYTVGVPRDVAVTVSTDAGAVTLTSLAGTVSAHADAGPVTCVDLRSPVSSFTSNAGGVIAAFSVPPTSLTATTNVGPIALTVPGSAAYRLNTHTFVGTSTITVRRDSASAHTITASSDVGSISISPS